MNYKKLALDALEVCKAEPSDGITSSDEAAEWITKLSTAVIILDEALSLAAQGVLKHHEYSECMRSLLDDPIQEIRNDLIASVIKSAHNQD
jgi:hypothetical protein